MSRTEYRDVHVPRCLGFDDNTVDDNNICIACDGNSSHDPLCQRSYKCNILAITRQLLQVIDEDNTERLLINDDIAIVTLYISGEL